MCSFGFTNRHRFKSLKPQLCHSIQKLGGIEGCVNLGPMLIDKRASRRIASNFEHFPVQLSSGINAPSKGWSWGMHGTRISIVVNMLYYEILPMLSRVSFDWFCVAGLSFLGNESFNWWWFLILSKITFLLRYISWSNYKSQCLKYTIYLLHYWAP